MKSSEKIEDMTADVFAEGLRKALRTDPDCIFLGEIREAGHMDRPDHKKNRNTGIHRSH